MSVPGVVKVNDVFNFFDTNKDGVWSAEECQRAWLELEGEEVSASEFAEMCTELGADPAQGLLKPHLKKLYADDPEQLDRAYAHIKGSTAPAPVAPPPTTAAPSFEDAPAAPVQAGVFSFGNVAEEDEAPVMGVGTAFSFGAAAPSEASDGVAPAPLPAPLPAPQQFASHASSLQSVMSEMMVERIFTQFDTDADGVWSFPEVQAAYTALQGDPLSRSQYEEMCEEMFAEADDGWDEGQLRAFYDGDSEALRRDYAKVVRGTRTSTAQPPRPPSTTIQPSAEAPSLARPASVASVPASSPAGPPSLQGFAGFTSPQVTAPELPAAPQSAPPSAPQSITAALSTASSVRSNIMVDRIMRHFDVDNDGFWSFAEVNTAMHGLQKAPLSYDAFCEECEGMFAEPESGWAEEHLRAMYYGDAAGLKRDYSLVLRAAKGGVATATTANSNMAIEAPPPPLPPPPPAPPPPPPASVHSSVSGSTSSFYRRAAKVPPAAVLPTTTAAAPTPTPTATATATTASHVGGTLSLQGSAGGGGSGVPKSDSLLLLPPHPVVVEYASQHSSAHSTRSNVMVERIFQHFDADADGLWCSAEVRRAEQVLQMRCTADPDLGCTEEQLRAFYDDDGDAMRRDYRAVVKQQSRDRLAQQPAPTPTPAPTPPIPERTTSTLRTPQKQASPAPSWSPAVSALTPTPPRHSTPPSDASVEGAVHPLTLGSRSDASDVSGSGAMLRRILDEFDANGDGRWCYEEANAARRALDGAGITRSEYNVMCTEVSAHPSEGLTEVHLAQLYTSGDMQRDYRRVLRSAQRRKRRSGSPTRRTFKQQPPPPVTTVYAEREMRSTNAAMEYIRMPFDVVLVKDAYVRFLDADYSGQSLDALKDALKRVNDELRMLQRIALRHSDLGQSLHAALQFRVMEDKQALHLRRDHCRRLGAYRNARPEDLQARDAYEGRPVTTEGTLADLHQVLRYIEVRVSAELVAFSPAELMDAISHHAREVEGMREILRVVEDWQELVSSTLTCRAFLKVERMEVADNANCRVYQRQLSDLSRAEMYLNGEL